MVFETPQNADECVNPDDGGDERDSDIDSDSDSEDLDSESSAGDDIPPYIQPPQSPDLPPVRHDPAGEVEPLNSRLRSTELRPRGVIHAPSKVEKQKPASGKRRTSNFTQSTPKYQSGNDAVHISLPLPPHGRARRIIDNQCNLWTAITMGSDARFISQSER